MIPSHQSDGSAPAPWFNVPHRQFVCVEHPAKILNIEKAVTTIGGERALLKLAETKGQSGVELRLRPEDPFQHPIRSRTVPTNNVLLKISIPKRKRKIERARVVPQVTSLPEAADAESLYHKLQSSNGNYTIEALGTIISTLRFRDIADFQYSTMHSPFANKFREHLIDCRYDKIKNFNLDPDNSILHTDIVPPPTFSKSIIPHLYNYRQNPAVKKAIIDGQATLLNLQAAPRTLTTMVHISSVDIPTGPPENIPDISTLDDFTRSCIQRLEALFSERPIWTRRALVNNFPPHLHPMIRFSMVHVAYMWRAGPWRDTCVVYGVDPRTDPKYRKYQSLFFQFEFDNIPMRTRDNTSHIFDGKNLVKDGRCFQLCDITDPLLKSLIEREKLRKTSHPQDGWYRSGTMIKIKSVMRKKIKALVGETTNSEAEAKIAIILQESSDEDEEGNQNPKSIAKQKRKKLLARAASDKRLGSRAHLQDTMEDEREEDDEVERNEDWEEGAAILESEWTAETVDQRVDEYMLELMKQVKENVDMEGERPLQEDTFDILEASSGDEG